MAFTLRLSDEDMAALRSRAEREGRSMQEVARTALNEYLSTRPDQFHATTERVRTEDTELLDRLIR